MKKLLKYLLKLLVCFLNISKNEAKILLFDLFLKYKVFDLSNKQQKVILFNLICYFELLLGGADTLKVKTNQINKNDILQHIEQKISDLSYIFRNYKFRLH